MPVIGPNCCDHCGVRPASQRPANPTLRHVAAFFLAGVLIAAPLATASAADSIGRSHPASLGRGTLHGYDWGASVRQGKLGPCVQMNLTSPPDSSGLSVTQVGALCGPIAGAFPSFVTVSGAGPHAVNATVIVFSREVRRVKLRLASGAQKNVTLRLLSKHRARRAKVHRLRYTTFVSTGCLRHVRGLLANGKRVYDSGRLLCGPNEAGRGEPRSMTFDRSFSID
jgi:hypothetical protein